MADTDTSSSAIQTRFDGEIAIVVLNRPERKNALSVQARTQLRAELGRLMQLQPCRAIILTGAGAAFCSGSDVRESGSADGLGSAGDRLSILHDIARLLATGPKPVVAAVDGVAYGAGFSLAAACDVVIATERASFCANFGQIGLLPDAGLLWTLPRRVGATAARRIIMTGQPVSGAEALAIGLADRLENPDGLLDSAIQASGPWRNTAPLALGAIKAALASGPASLDATLELEHQVQPLLSQSHDRQEARDAFIQKRKPVFRGC